jgi:two-component sensor histidine kinase
LEGKRVKVNHPFELEVRDDGVGIPEELNIYRTETLGLQFITPLVKKLDRSLLRSCRAN